jgi:hypothetical protein
VNLSQIIKSDVWPRCAESNRSEVKRDGSPRWLSLNNPGSKVKEKGGEELVQRSYASYLWQCLKRGAILSEGQGNRVKGQEGEGGFIFSVVQGVRGIGGVGVKGGLGIGSPMSLSSMDEFFIY